MNRLFILGIAVAIGVAAPAAAQGVFLTGASGTGAATSVAGAVSLDGAALHGSGFTVRRRGPGQYAITLQHGVFKTGCAAMTVAGTGLFPILTLAAPRPCPARQPRFEVNTFDAKSGQLTDEDFQFVAVEMSP
jgi:hypothetical protein